MLNPMSDDPNEISSDMTKNLSFGKKVISCVDENSEFQQYESEKDSDNFNQLEKK